MARLHNRYSHQEFTWFIIRHHHSQSSKRIFTPMSKMPMGQYCEPKDGECWVRLVGRPIDGPLDAHVSINVNVADSDTDTAGIQDLSFDVSVYHPTRPYRDEELGTFIKTAMRAITLHQTVRQFVPDGQIPNCQSLYGDPKSIAESVREMIWDVLYQLAIGSKDLSDKGNHNILHLDEPGTERPKDSIEWFKVTTKPPSRRPMTKTERDYADALAYYSASECISLAGAQRSKFRHLEKKAREIAQQYHPTLLSCLSSSSTNTWPEPLKELKKRLHPHLLQLEADAFAEEWSDDEGC